MNDKVMRRLLVVVLVLGAAVLSVLLLSWLGMTGMMGGLSGGMMGSGIGSRLDGSRAARDRRRGRRAGLGAANVSATLSMEVGRHKQEPGCSVAESDDGR